MWLNNMKASFTASQTLHRPTKFTPTCTKWYVCMYIRHQLFRSYISCLSYSSLWLKFTTVTFNMTRVAYNNVYRALMGITRGYGHSIPSEFCTKNIDGFEAVLRKMISSLRAFQNYLQYMWYICAIKHNDTLYTSLLHSGATQGLLDESHRGFTRTGHLLFVQSGNKLPLDLQHIC